VCPRLRSRQSPFKHVPFWEAEQGRARALPAGPWSTGESIVNRP